MYLVLSLFRAEQQGKHGCAQTSGAAKTNAAAQAGACWGNCCQQWPWLTRKSVLPEQDKVLGAPVWLLQQRRCALQHQPGDT
jgi:hypothetical protein